MTHRQGILRVVPSVAAHAKTRPDDIALRTLASSVSYAELAGLAGSAQAVLDAMRPGPVAVMAKKSPRAVAVILACLAARRPVLLPPVDLGRLAFDDACDRACVACVVEVGESDWHFAARQPGIASANMAGLLADASFLLTTSGSTGTPKLVPLPTGSVNRFIAWAGERFAIRDDSVVLNYAPLNFDLCLLDVWATLARGGCSVLVDQDRAARPSYLLDLCTTTAPTLVQGVPLLYQVLLQVRPRRSYPSVTRVILTGDHTPATVRGQLPDLFPRARFYNVYGCTETNDSFIYEFGADQARQVSDLPIGWPIPGVSEIVVAEDVPLAGPGTGELLASTPFQANGYLGDDPSGRFVRRAGAVYFRTGDLVRREPSGLTHLTGRSDFQVKVRGARINLEQVELALAEADDVLEVAAVARPDAHGHAIHLLVRVRPGAALTPLAIRSQCAERLARVMIPSSIALMNGPLPRTTTGKIDRKRILQELERGSA